MMMGYDDPLLEIQQAIFDLRDTGTMYLWTAADGSIHRLNPRRVMIVCKDGELSRVCVSTSDDYLKCEKVEIPLHQLSAVLAMNDGLL